jgi:nucleoside-diphosphate-sugar epimerase
MKLLVLGGSDFVGRAVVDVALHGALDHETEVTVLNRGRTPAPGGVRALTGDRTTPGGLDALTSGPAAGQEWDVVVDTWSWASYAVRDAARALAGRAGRYVYVSTRSVYTWPVAAGAREDAPMVAGDPDAGRDGAEVAYAEAKRGGELAVLESFGPDRSLLLRAGLILGPRENIGRLPWWLTRIARGGAVPAPGPADLGVQYVDARDLAGFALDAAHRGVTGAFDVVSPPGFTTMRELLETCVAVTGSSAELRWVSPEDVAAVGVAPWTDLPVWLPPGEEHESLHEGDTAKAAAAGLSCRPVTDTVADTWAWMTTRPGGVPHRPDRSKVGLGREAEAALLERAAASR